MDAVPESINFPAAEEEILKYWESIDAFRTSLKRNQKCPKFTFYDGPPFATGLPHYGHILTGTIKDIVTRFAAGSGFYVERRFGWDCHGLPIEYEIDKTCGIKGPADVEAMGIKAYNDKCRAIVMKYSDQWRQVVTRTGRWIDFDHDYKTMYPWFMESVWWAFSQLYQKGLVYQGVKVMPYSTGCNTPLSNFESGQNYKDVVDPSVVVRFPLDDDATGQTALVAWTTTPWTLPSNLALCVNPSMDYVEIEDRTAGPTGGQKLILMEARLEILGFKSPDDFAILNRFKGKTLEGRRYQPAFPYFAYLKTERGAFQVVCDDYVTTESGTGVVHQAPYFGEDDHRVCLKYKIITKDMKMVCPVDASGTFTEPVSDFLGLYVKDADKKIIEQLKAAGRLVSASQHKHSYPFCWRSETPLIYKAVPSLFIRVEPLVSQLLANNSETYWVPDFVKEKRFANWLRDARDWAVSRNRYWGTPIPLWVSEDGEEMVCVGSIAELAELSGITTDDLHRDVIDSIQIPSLKSPGTFLKRVPEVFDCWFESGSMPYAQNHYPFENAAEFESHFPADFIAEGVDQTRGWFYTLLVLSTALFGRPPFKNLIVNGLVLASDGNKMSKRKKNYPDPMDVVNSYGADALRLYLINSPVVRGENLRFREEGVRDLLKDVFIPWFNAFRFFGQNVHQLQQEEPYLFGGGGNPTKGSSIADPQSSPNIMDQWILSFTNSLVSFVNVEMAAYRLYTVVPRLVTFVETLTNWYIRMNRKRLKGETGREDCIRALETLSNVLLTIVRVMTPFTPFITEFMYQKLKPILAPALQEDSVHYLRLPAVDLARIHSDIERKVAGMQQVIDLARVIRERRTIPLKYPVSEIVVIHRSEEFLADCQFLEKYILEEVNARKLTTSTEKEAYGVKLRAEPDHKSLGSRLKKDFKTVMAAIKGLPDAEVSQFLNDKQIEIGGHLLGPEDLRIMYQFDDAELQDVYEANSENQVLVLVDIRPDQTLQDEGLAREIVNRIQKLRKKAKLVPTDQIDIYIRSEPPGSDVTRVRSKMAEFIETSVKQPVKHFPLESLSQSVSPVVIEEEATVKDATLTIAIVRREVAGGDPGAAPPIASPGGKSANPAADQLTPTIPVCKSAVAPVVETRPKNGPIKLRDDCGSVEVFLASGGDSSSMIGQKVLLECPPGQFLDFQQFLFEVRNLYDGWSWGNVTISLDKQGAKRVKSMGQLRELKGGKVFAHDSRNL